MMSKIFLSILLFFLNLYNLKLFYFEKSTFIMHEQLELHDFQNLTHFFNFSKFKSYFVDFFLQKLHKF